MKNLIITTMAGAILFIANACTPNTPAAGCSANTEFQNAYGTLLGINQVTFDANVHAYSFEVTSAKTVCKIGYQNQTGTAGLSHTIEIFDATTNSSIFSQSKVFSTTATDYITPANSINLIPGHIYWLKRIQSSTNFADQIGRLSNANTTFTFPITNGALKITGAKFYPLSSSLASTTPSVDMIPFIDIQFQ